MSFVSEHWADGAQYYRTERAGRLNQGSAEWSAPLNKAGFFAKELHGTARFVLLPKTPRTHSEIGRTAYVDYQHSVSGVPLLIGAAIVVGIAVWWGRRHIKKRKA